MPSNRPARFIFDPGYDYGRGLPVRQVHGFRLDKPSRIKSVLTGHGIDLERFERVTEDCREALGRAHTAELVRGLDDAKAIARAAELPPLGLLPRFLLRKALVDPQLRAASGTAQALRLALDQGGFVFNCSGGYHHARPGLSHGFCLVNDVAIAISTVRAEGRRPKILVLDLDLHQGDGNAAAFRDDDDVFTASIHEEAVFPFPKLESSLDIGLESYLGDAEYLEAIDGALAQIEERGFSPDVVMYVAGTDPHRDDPLGTLGISHEGLLERDRRVARFVRKLGCGLVASPAGGYTESSPELSGNGFAAMAAIGEGRI